MKKFGLFLLWFVLMLFIGNFTLAKDYEYTNLDIQADIKIDGTIDVTETFTANFFKKKHGIIRFIPLNYTVDGTDFHIDLDYIRVDGNKFSTYTEDGGVNIKIGDPNVEIKGEKVYPIFYSVYGLIRNFAGMGYHELYWNIVGYDFDTNIDKFRAEINLPKIYRGFTSGDFLITVDGNTTSISDFDGNVDWITSDKIVITYNKKLDAGDGITLAIKFPKDYFNFDHERQNSLLGRVNTDTSSSSSFQSSFLDLFSNSDFISSILTFLIIIFGMFFMPSEGVGGSYSSGSSYSSSSGFSGGSSFGGGFSRGGGGGGGGSKSW